MSNVIWFYFLYFVLVFEPSGNDLLDYIPANSYWQQKSVEVSFDNMIAELKKGCFSDLPTKKANVASCVRTLMAIKTLGEIKAEKARPLLLIMCSSQDFFLSDYAKQAIASIDNKSYSRSDFPVSERKRSLDLIPDKYNVIIQANTEGLFGDSKRICLKKPLCKIKAYLHYFKMSKDEVQAVYIKGIVEVAELIGNVRISGATIGQGLDSNETDFKYPYNVLWGKYDFNRLKHVLSKKSKNIVSRQGITIYDFGYIALVPISENCLILLRSCLQLSLIELVDVIKNCSKKDNNRYNSLFKTGHAKRIDSPLWAFFDLQNKSIDAPVFDSVDWLNIVTEKNGKDLSLTFSGKIKKDCDNVVSINKNSIKNFLNQDLMKNAKGDDLSGNYYEFLEQIKIKRKGNLLIGKSIWKDKLMQLIFKIPLQRMKASSRAVKSTWD